MSRIFSLRLIHVMHALTSKIWITSLSFFLICSCLWKLCESYLSGQNFRKQTSVKFLSRNHESKARRGTQWAKRKRNVEQTLTTDCFISLASHQNWQTPHYLPLLNVTWMTFCVLSMFVTVCGLFDFRNFTFHLGLCYVCSQWAPRLSCFSIPCWKYAGSM